MSKEQLVLTKISSSFEGENMQTQYVVLGYSIDLYFHDYKLAIENGQNWYINRNIDYEIKRQKAKNKNLVVWLLELVLTKKLLIFLKLLMKYLGTSNNRLINRPKKV